MVTRFLVAIGIHPVMAFIPFGFGLWFVVWIVLGVEFRVDGHDAAWYALWYTIADIVICIFLLSNNQPANVKKIAPLKSEKRQSNASSNSDSQNSSVPKANAEASEPASEPVSEREIARKMAREILTWPFTTTEDAYAYCMKHEINISKDDENLIRVANALYRAVQKLEREKAQEAAAHQPPA